MSLCGQADDTQTGESTPDEKQAVKTAVEARSKLRLAESYSRLRSQIDGEGGKIRLIKYQREVLSDFDSGKLFDEANEATKTSGNGRLKRRDGTILDIGGSTIGAIRQALDGFVAAETNEFDDDRDHRWLR